MAGDTKESSTVSPSLGIGEEATTLLRVSRDVALALAASTDLAEAMQQLVLLCLDIPCLDAAGVYVVDHKARELRLIAHEGVSDEFVALVEHYDFEAPQAQLSLAGKPVYATGVNVLDGAPAVSMADGLSGVGIIPIAYSGQIIGVFNIATRRADEIPACTRYAAETIAVQIAASMARLIADAERSLLMRELNHRVRNNLSMVLALAGQALNETDSIDYFRKTFVGRLSAMSRLHESFASSGWSDMAVRKVVERALDPLRGRNIHLDGPLTRLRAYAANPLCLVVHELGANALMHGSLSVEEGRVSLSWRLSEHGDLLMDWIEEGGPEIPPDAETGTGTRIMRALLTGQLAGAIDFDYQPTGLRCHMRIPSAQLEQAGNSRRR